MDTLYVEKVERLHSRYFLKYVLTSNLVLQLLAYGENERYPLNLI